MAVLYEESEEASDEDDASDEDAEHIDQAKGTVPVVTQWDYYIITYSIYGISLLLSYYYKHNIQHIIIIILLHTVYTAYHYYYHIITYSTAYHHYNIILHTVYTAYHHYYYILHIIDLKLITNKTELLVGFKKRKTFTLSLTAPFRVKVL